MKREPQSIDSIFETILADIVRGFYAPGKRLPAERELARTLGASRPTLREALRRLSEWRLVEPKRGSGIVVRDVTEWSIEVLPAFLRYRPTDNQETSFSQLFEDLLGLRRSMFSHIVEVVAPRVSSEGVENARRAVEKAWAAKEDGALFIKEDFNVMRSIVAGANFYPAVWLLNRLAGVYLDMAGSISAALPPPANYYDVHQEFLDALAARDHELANQIIRAYLIGHDNNLIKTLAIFS